MAPPALTPAPVDSVVAWHNRHPLALRITAAQVRSPGWVSLPLALRTGAEEPLSESGSEAGPAPPRTLRERAMARTHGAYQPAPQVMAPPNLAGAEPAFSEDLLPPHTARELARFACQQGSSRALEAAARPRREVRIDSGLAGAGRPIAWLHLQTAAIEAGDRRTRVLIGCGVPVAVLGRRLLSRLRLAAVAVFVLALLGATLVWTKSPPTFVGGAPVPPAAGDGAAPAAAAAPEMMSPLPVATGSERPTEAAASALASPAPLPASAPTLASAPASVANPVAVDAAPVTPALAAPPPPAIQSSASIRPRLDPDLAKEVRRESAALRAASAAGLGAPAKTMPASSPDVARVASPHREWATAPAVTTQTSASAAGSAVYALVARTTRSRAASAVLLGAMAGEAGRNGNSPRAEVLSAEGGYRASLWPFNSREQALRAQQRLRETGLATELVSF